MPIPSELLKEALSISLERIARIHWMFGDQFPTSGKTVTTYRLTANDNWVTGFWTGLLWLAYSATKNEELRSHAARLTKSFRERLDQNVHINHDLGFLYSLSARADWQLTGSQEAYQLALDAAERLSHRFRPRGSYIQAWGEPGEESQGGRIIVDTMMNLPLLFWATEKTGDIFYGEVARQHADTCARFIVRPDATTYHTYYFDQKTGAPIGPKTHQGFKDDSAWSRGQAWATFGFTAAAEWRPEEPYLEIARRTTDWFMANLPEDGVPYWDFRLTPDAPQYRDSSAGAIAAAGMLRLSRLLPASEGRIYYDHAVRLLESLSRHCLERDPEGQGLLRHASGFVFNGSYDCYLIYGDYYFLEALLMLDGKAPDFWGK
ncbi:MAG TPA: glycoside hydrolase family 88 protein [Anaerolineaceae bacterium]